jgi:hypothetical protein
VAAPPGLEKDCERFSIHDDEPKRVPLDELVHLLDGPLKPKDPGPAYVTAGKNLCQPKVPTEVSRQSAAHERAEFRRMRWQRTRLAARRGSEEVRSGMAALAAQLASLLQAGGVARLEAFAWLQDPELTRSLSFGPAGCRTVQLALDQALDFGDKTFIEQVAAAFHGFVVDAIKSSHANFVIHKIVTVLALDDVPFFVEEIYQAGPELAKHEYGCRIFSRLLEVAPLNEHKVRLVDSVLSEVEVLLTHVYGYLVVKSILEHGLARQRSQIIMELRRNFILAVQCREGAVVLENAILQGSSEEIKMLASDLLAMPFKDFSSLVNLRRGCMAVQAMLQAQPSVAQDVQQRLRDPALLPQLQNTEQGRDLLSHPSLSFFSI